MSIKEYEQLSPKKRNRIKLFIGHNNFDTGIPAADSALIVTVLREPIARVKSFIRFAAAGNTHFGRNNIGTELCIDSLLDSQSTELCNLQVKHLTNQSGVEWNQRLNDLGDNGALCLAKERLFNKIHSFGIQEYFDESWVAIWHSLGKIPPVYASKNRGTFDYTFSDEQERKIREMNRLDTELYNAAKKEFEMRLSRGIISTHMLDDFRRRQRIYGPALTLIHTSASFLYWSYRKRFKK